MVNHREILDKPVPSLEEMIEFAFLLLLPISLVISWIIDFSAVLIYFFIITSFLSLFILEGFSYSSGKNKEGKREYNFGGNFFLYSVLVILIVSIIITYLLKTEFLFLPLYVVLLIGFFGFLCNRWIKGLAKIN
ncbi:MAG: hypothetical protein DRP06_03275 [Candidatus Aenigmatarchaeota archaeon]|nr:MAG: hypothetical protein DRP06_03275 [Candidatus Aenigmarchaeota archaeon]